jgi:opacity protein-like surface antigen
MSKKVLLVSTLALGLATSAAFASGGMPVAPCPANTFTPGIIVGLQAGFVDTGWESFEGNNWNTFATENGVSVSDDTGFGGRIYLGYDAYDWLGFELGYLYFFQKTDIQSNTIDARSRATQDETQQYKSDIRTQAIDLVGKLKSPTWNGWGLYAKAGVAYMMSSDRNESVGTNIAAPSDDQYLDDSVNKFAPVYGVGLAYTFQNLENLSLDLSWTRYDSGHEKLDNEYLPNLDFYALGIAYKFDI